MRLMRIVIVHIFRHGRVLILSALTFEQVRATVVAGFSNVHRNVSGPLR